MRQSWLWDSYKRLWNTQGKPTLLFLANNVPVCSGCASLHRTVPCCITYLIYPTCCWWSIRRHCLHRLSPSWASLFTSFQVLCAARISSSDVLLQVPNGLPLLIWRSPSHGSVRNSVFQYEEYSHPLPASLLRVLYDAFMFVGFLFPPFFKASEKTLNFLVVLPVTAAYSRIELTLESSIWLYSYRKTTVKRSIVQYRFGVAACMDTNKSLWKPCA